MRARATSYAVARQCRKTTGAGWAVIETLDTANPFAQAATSTIPFGLARHLYHHAGLGAVD